MSYRRLYEPVTEIEFFVIVFAFPELTEGIGSQEILTGSKGWRIAGLFFLRQRPLPEITKKWLEVFFLEISPLREKTLFAGDSHCARKSRSKIGSTLENLLKSSTHRPTIAN
jgi:hypothetical protein